MNTFTSHVSALLPQLAAGEHRTPGTPSPAASPTRGGIPQRLRPRRRIASRASPARQAKDTSRACPSPARRRIPISGHKIPILTIGYLPPPSPGVSGAWGSHLAPGGPLLVRWQSAASGTLIITLPTTPGVSFWGRLPTSSERSEASKIDNFRPKLVPDWSKFKTGVRIACSRHLVELGAAEAVSASDRALRPSSRA